MTAPRIAVVTGATSGIGRATAVRIARDGFHIIACGRDPARGAATVASVVAAGGTATFHAFDVTAHSWPTVLPPITVALMHSSTAPVVSFPSRYLTPAWTSFAHYGHSMSKASCSAQNTVCA
jgi:NAD(P)-dependent dehydrogenase (short-subunit alcohol dehydrogenase family)